MDKAIFVTGGTIGSGLAVAERFAKEGYNVVITSRNGERAENAAKSIAAKYKVRAYGYALDIRDEQRVKDIFCDIDNNKLFVETVCLNSADMGFGSDPAKGMPMFECSIEEFQRVFETNLVWNFMIIRQAAIRMREHHRGAIVFISSNTAYRAIPNRVAYSTSKGGINAFTKARGKELAPSNISVNAISCGVIDTAMNSCFDEEERQCLADEIPAGRFGKADEVASLSFSLANESSYLTSQVITLDGGWQ